MPALRRKPAFVATDVARQPGDGRLYARLLRPQNLTGQPKAKCSAKVVVLRLFIVAAKALRPFAHQAHRRHIHDVRKLCA